MSPFEFAKTVKDKNDFVQFLQHLLDDFETNSDNWQNTKLDHYIESMGAFLESSKDPSFKEIDFTPAWGVFAEIMVAASIYE